MGKEISLNDLIVVFLKNIKKIILIAVGGGVLFSVRGIIKAFTGGGIGTVFTGFFVGLLFTALIVYLVFVYKMTHSKFVTGVDDIRRRYAFPVLGDLTEASAVQGGPLLAKLVHDDRPRRSVRKEVTLESLKLIQQEHQYIVISSVKTKKMVSLVKSLFPELQLDVYCDLSSSPEAIRALSNVDGVILAEKINMTEFSLLNEEIMRIESLDKKIFGLILL